MQDVEMVFQATVSAIHRHHDESYSHYDCDLLKHGWGKGIGDVHKVLPNIQTDPDTGIEFVIIAAKGAYQLGDIFEISFRRTGNVDDQGT